MNIHQIKMEMIADVNPASDECLERLGYKVLSDGRMFFDRTYLGQRAKDIWRKLDNSEKKKPSMSGNSSRAKGC